MTSVSGSNILVTGGVTKETYDSVRHIRNSSRSENHGHKVAIELAKQGAKVTLVTAKTHVAKPDGVIVVDSKKDGSKIVSTTDLKDAIDEQLLSTWFDTVVNLAVTPSVKPAEIRKEKVKRDKKSGKPESIAVRGNTDLLNHIPEKTGATQIIGYDRKQNLKTVRGDSDLESLITEQNTGERVTIGETIPSRSLGRQPLDGKRILITSGRTEEQITQSGDVITNFASGRQGHAIAQAFADMGANVVLVTGPTYLPDPDDEKIQTIHINSSTELRDTCLEQIPADAAVCVCAVADFGLDEKLDLNLSESEKRDLVLNQMPDTLKTIGTHDTKRPTVVIGFAAETNNLINYAKGKLNSKGANAIVANDVGAAMVKRNRTQNQVFFETPDGVEPMDEMSKYDVGLQIGEKIAGLL